MEDFSDLLNPMELDAIGEIMNISLGSSATAISNMVDKRVNITTPSVEVVSIVDFEYKNLEPAVGVEITYTDGLEGNNIMLLKRGDVKVIVELLMSTEIPDEEFELNDLTISAISEVMNQMMGAASTALAEFLGEVVNISTPISFEVTDAEEFKAKYFTPGEPMIVVRFDLSIEDRMESEFINVMSPKLAKKMIAGFGLANGEDTQPEPEPVSAVPGSVLSDDSIAALLESASATASPEQAAPAAVPVPVTAPTPAVFPAAAAAPVYQAPVFDPRMIQTTPIMAATQQYIDLSSLDSSQASNLDLLMSVPLQLTVEIGRAKKPLKEVLEFGTDTLVVLDKLAGDTVDLYVNGQCVARGDVVVIDDYFGVRITEIVKSPESLLK